MELLTVRFHLIPACKPSLYALLFTEPLQYVPSIYHQQLNMTMLLLIILLPNYHPQYYYWGTLMLIAISGAATKQPYVSSNLKTFYYSITYLYSTMVPLLICILQLVYSLL